METMKKAEYIISAVSPDEKYDGTNQVSVKLIIDYEKKVYEIIPPIIRVETECKFPLLVSEAIKYAYNKAKMELYNK